MYTHECIDRMLIAENSLRLAAFGRLVVGPWLSICTPAFPAHRVSAVGAPDQGQRPHEPVVRLDPDAWVRLQSLLATVTQVLAQDLSDRRKETPIQRRFRSAIYRFGDTFHQGYWDSVIVDLVIVMESLLTPNKQGGRMQLALAASNLLGTTAAESKEIFDNVTLMYRLRNSSVHGEPLTQEEWDKQILKIAQTAGSVHKSLDRGGREYAFEVMRDYARRTICAMLHLDHAGRPPSSEVTHDIHRLHLDPTLRSDVQQAAKTYPLASRSSPPV